VSERVVIAFFDLDRTLVDVNSGRLWMQREWREGRLSWGDALRASWWLLRYTAGADGLLYAYEAAVSRLAGDEEAPLADRTRAWFDAEVRHRLRPGASEAIHAHRAAGHRLVLATSSTPYVAAAAVAAYGLDDWIATRFEVVEGRFTGRIASSAYGADKADRAAELAERWGASLADCAFYTDSMSDFALLERVGAPRIVSPDRRLAAAAAARGWPVLEWGVSANEYQGGSNASEG
jgi:HAD superfamily hydrolase (TIGR01490 family)